MSRTRRSNPRNIRRAEQIENDVATRNWAQSSAQMLLRIAKHLRYGQVGSDCHMPFPDGKKGYDGWSSTGTNNHRWAKRMTAKIMRRRGRKVISEALDE